MQSVEKNNPRIIALQKWLDAEETNAKTGIYPDNPEINYNFLWGSPENVDIMKQTSLAD